jgi:hypothetical protein
MARNCYPAIDYQTDKTKKEPKWVLSGSNGQQRFYEVKKKIGSARKSMSGLPATFLMAKKMGEKLGRSKVLFR